MPKGSGVYRKKMFVVPKDFLCLKSSSLDVSNSTIEDQKGFG